MDESGETRRVRVCDCRSRTNVEPRMITSERDYNAFLRELSKEFSLNPQDVFVLTTTDRTVLDFDKFAELQDGSMLYLLHEANQALPKAMEESINYTPHYNTIISGGLHEYYSSEGKNPLPYALAELIDNSLCATASNPGRKTIELRMLFDKTQGIPALIAVDNGRGMTSKELNNWAVYRLSKFNKTTGTLRSQSGGYLPPDHVPRSLNSDISYFGVGGKQAAFFIGDSVRMISKSVTSPDVHELLLSKKQFESKEKNNEDVYGGTIKNRQRGDTSHASKEERYLRDLIAEEREKESFTAVVITGIDPAHLSYLTENFEEWTRQLAHTYHYYIHGVHGNDLKGSPTNPDHPLQVDIQVNMQGSGNHPPSVLNLREVDDDMQTLYINAAVDTFEFKGITGGSEGVTVEGFIRYHPFLYDRETYPDDPSNAAAPQDDDENEPGVRYVVKRQQEIFECFWNGRLIPYTRLSPFKWCEYPGKSKTRVPEECYGRFSGVLFTSDRFQVTTNKLTFTDLEQKVKSNDMIFERVINGKEQRLLPKMFEEWLESCHEKFDKQVKFMDFKGTIEREDKYAKKSYPWASFDAIEWEGRIFRKDKLVKTQKTNPIHCGRVVRFVLHGIYKGDVFATGGEVEISLEPKELHNTTKFIKISNINRTALVKDIQGLIANDFDKLPHELKVTWPQGNPWPHQATRPAGIILGPLQVEILNKKNESISNISRGRPLCQTYLRMKLTIVKKSGAKDVTILSLVASHIQKQGFWFTKIENLSEPGAYTLCLQTIVNDTSEASYGGRKLPHYTFDFTITEGSAKDFVVDEVSSPLHVGEPFNIPVQLRDSYGNLVKPEAEVIHWRPELKCGDLAMSYDNVEIRGSKLIIAGVRARGKVQPPMMYTLEVTLPDLKRTETLKLHLLPGAPHSLHVKTEGNPIILENGNPARFDVEIHDEAGNVTAHPKLIVTCKIDGVQQAVINCSRTGEGQLVTKPVDLELQKGEPQVLKVLFDIASQKNLAAVSRELKVVPSKRVADIKLYGEVEATLELKNDEKIKWMAGSSLENLYYRLFDEAGSLVPLTKEIAKKIKVNWTRDVNPEHLVQGKLPVVLVPKLVNEERSCEVSYQDHRIISVSFTVKPYPNEAANIRVTLPQKSLKLGEALTGHTCLELIDCYENPSMTLDASCVKQMKVEAEGLEKSTVSFIWQEVSKSVLVTGICLHAGTPGIRELKFTYMSFETCVPLKVTAGDPAQLKLITQPPQPLQVVNDEGVPTPFVLQIFDKWDNPSTDRRVMVELETSPPALKLKTGAVSQPVDSEGKTSFTLERVSGPKGSYQLDFKGLFNNVPIAGPSVRLTLLPNPNKPVELVAAYDATAALSAGGTFPVFSVTVVSEDGSPMTTFKPAAVSMWLWEASSRIKPPHATELKCSKPLENEREDCFYFRNKEIPTLVGKYIVQFSLTATAVLHSDQIPITVVANEPVRLGPSVQPKLPVVSCSAELAKRTLVENLTLSIMDAHDNPAGQELRGRVVVSIVSDDPGKVTPLFDGRTQSYTMVEGQVHIKRLAVMVNSPGEDGSTYTLLFQPEVPSLRTPPAPFKLTFHFYNDEVNQKRMSELLRRSTELTVSLQNLEKHFEDRNKLLLMMSNKLGKDNAKVGAVKAALHGMNVGVRESVPEIERLLQEKSTEKEAILAAPRRKCTIPRFREQQDVLGKVCHLAHVEDDAATRVISWHMGGDMDCVIARTTEAAQRIYRDTAGEQQVMGLDGIFVHPQDRPLPHIIGSRDRFRPTGNPVFARDLLEYPNDPEDCAKVFKGLLRDTIVIDDLESGNHYRVNVVKNKIPCPTILTRTGDRINSSGKFGGRNNRVPSSRSMPVFGAGLPQEINVLREQTELLRLFRDAVHRRNASAEEHLEESNDLNTPENTRKREEMEKMRVELRDITAQLASTPPRAPKRSRSDAAGTLVKRRR